MPSDPRTVYISTASTPALGEPQFLIEHQGRIYLSVAVLEYDPGQSDPEQRQEASRLQGLLASGEPVKATLYTHGPVAFFANAEPGNL
jgi:hypothetical protein